MAGMKIRFTEKSSFVSYLTRNAKLCILLFTLSLAVPLFAASTEASDVKQTSPSGVLADISAAQEGGALTVTMKTDRLLEPKAFRLENPPRLVIDFENTINRVPFMKLPLNAASAKQLRVSQFQEDGPRIARVVFDLGVQPVIHKIALEKTSVQVTLLEGASSKEAKPPVVPTPSVKPALKADIPAKKADSGSKAASPVPSVSASSATVSAGATASQSTKSDPVTAASTGGGQGAATKRVDPAAAVAPPVKPSAEKTASAPVKKPVVPTADQVPAGRVSVPPQDGLQKQKSVSAEANTLKTTDPVLDTPDASLLLASLQATSVPLPKADNKGNTVTQAVGENAAASRFSGQLLTLDLVDLPLVDFFRVMSEEAGINIVLDPKVKGSISIKVEKLPWDQIFDMVLVNHSLDRQIEGNLIRIATKSTLQEEAKQKEALKKAEVLAADLETRVRRLNYTKADTLINTLTDLKTVRGTVVQDERTNSLIMTDIPSSLDEMMRLVTTLDIPQPQVEIEARIVSAARDFAREIGVQFGFVKGNLERVTVGGPNTFGTIGGTRPSATPDSAYAAGNDLTGRGASESTASESGAVSPGGAGNYNVNLPSTKAFGGLGISIGNIFDTFLLDAALTAGESKGQAKLISQPKVTAQNNTPAVISQGTRFPVLVRSNNTTTVQFYNAALTLTVTPQITYEGNIVLDLKVANNTADWGRTVESVPSIRISESESRVLVSDGGTTVIGGIIIDEDSTSEDKVPGLGSLPLVGNLFRRNAASRTSQEVLFFVTPRIIK